MFSYSWAAEAENVRTLAKAMWLTGVGVWIDVVKLTPGDDIRSIVRAVAHRVQTVVIFMSPAYVASANCVVEFLEAIQRPAHCLVCVVKPLDPSITAFLSELGIPIVTGFPALIAALDARLQQREDDAALQWWRKQQIAGAGVPNNIVATGWPMSRFSLWGRLHPGLKAVCVGPVYLQGDCQKTGQRISPPWLLLLAILAVTINFVDLYQKMTGSDPHTVVDFISLALLSMCNLMPFIALDQLVETRIYLSTALKPLLASKAVGGGVSVRVIGDPDLSIVLALRKFLTKLGHEAKVHPTITIAEAVDQMVQKRKTTNAELTHRQEANVDDQAQASPSNFQPTTPARSAQQLPAFGDATPVLSACPSPSVVAHATASTPNPSAAAPVTSASPFRW